MTRYLMRRNLVNVSVLVISFACSLFMAELVTRSVLDPVDYLNPTLVTDELLNHRIDGHTGGHDAWGFRNLEVPKVANIVCIGDSTTYGIAALAHESWPAVLGQLRSEIVYNMSLGGYGPIQYLHLMRTMAVRLHPRTVIVGFYFGNDLGDAYVIVRFNKNWSSYGSLTTAEKAPAFVFPRQAGRFLEGVRDWLSRHSVLYSLMSKMSGFDFVRVRETATRLSSQTDSLISYRDSKHHVLFDVSPRSRYLNLDDPRIKAGLDITEQAFLDMRRFSYAEGFRLIVVLIPTKERAYGRYLERSNFIQGYAALREAVRQEDVARDAIKSFLHEQNVEVVDLLPALEAEIEQRDPFPLTDPHPSRVSYRVIAETINRYLNNVPRATAQSKSLPAERRPSTSGASASSEEQTDAILQSARPRP